MPERGVDGKRAEILPALRGFPWSRSFTNRRGIARFSKKFAIRVCDRRRAPRSPSPVATGSSTQRSSVSLNAKMPRFMVSQRIVHVRAARPRSGSRLGAVAAPRRRVPVGARTHAQQREQRERARWASDARLISSPLGVDARVLHELADQPLDRERALGELDLLAALEQRLLAARLERDELVAEQARGADRGRWCRPAARASGPGRA